MSIVTYPEHFIFTEKYRPRTIEDCILPEPLKNTFRGMISEGRITHMLLSGVAGVGKTSIALVLCNEIGAEYLLINGSNEGRCIDTLRTSIRQFASTISLTDSKKVIIIDESDGMLPLVQNAMKTFIEEFSSNCTFILTCNNKSKIIEPIHSRCTCIDFKINPADKQLMAATFFKRAIAILGNENIEFDPKVVAELVSKHFPDYRRTLNELQRYSVTGKIDSGILLKSTDEVFTPVLKHLKDKNFTEVRNWVKLNSEIGSPELFRKLYDRSTEIMELSSIPQLVLILADYGYKSVFVVDQEINIMAALTEIMSSVKFL